MTSIKLKSFTGPVAGAAAIAALCLSGVPSQAQEFTMKFATLTINDIQHEALKLYKEELEKVSGGRIKVEIYPSGQLGGAPRQTEGLRLGTIEAAIGPPELFFGADRRFQVLAMAGMFKDNEHGRKVLDNAEFRKIFSEFSATRGMLAVGYHMYDQQMFVFRTPVTNLAGFAGKRTRVLASEAEQAAVASLGAAPVPMSLPEVVPALQQGTIDGVSTVIGVFVPFRYNDAAPNIVDTRLWALTATAFISKIWYDKLPPDLQKMVTATGAKHEAQLHQWQNKRIAEDTKTWLDRGGKIVKLSAADQADAVKRVAASLQSVLDKNPPSKELYTKLKAIADTVK
jgi:TRAP-type C4-dicarboxylate transport system substrate-binding protein